MHVRPATACVVLALAAPLFSQTDWCSYFGHDGDDWIMAMTTDALGRIYVCGQTDVGTHVTANTYQPGIAGGYDAFVACVDPRLPVGQQLVWSTHLGGSNDDVACDLHVGPGGAWVTVVGYTTSTDFPVRAGWQMQHGGGRDGFVAVFDPSRTGTAQLLWATYLGGSRDDVAASVDEWNGMPTIAGTTDSSDFPTANGWQPVSAGFRDLFVCRLSPAGMPLFSTYLGGSADEGLDTYGAPFGVRSVHVVADDSGAVTVASSTDSPDYPNANAMRHGPTGGLDLAVTCFDFAGSRLLYSAVVGGSQDEHCHELRADGAGRVVLVGRSTSPDFPTSANRLQGLVDTEDGLLVHLDLAADRILYATYLGGTSWDSPMAAYREPSGTFVVGGYSFSADFPITPGAPQPQQLTRNGQAFLARLRPGPTSSALQYATWFGASVAQAVLALEPDGQGGVIAAGPTVSPDFPTTANAFDTSFDGIREGWIGVHRMLPALASRLGHATSPCGPSTYLQMNSAPLSPNAGFAVETHDAPAGAPGALALGVPLPAGAALFNVDLFVTTPLIAIPAAAGAGGFASQPLPIPAGFVWSGRLALQSLWVAPVACGGALLGASNALR